MATTYTPTQITQIMMTLSALANISTTPGPGESLTAQQGRIHDGISDMLNQSQNLGLATAAGNWTLVWVGLSQSSTGKDENLSYIATDNNTPPNVAVVVRGTTDVNEILEDIDCGPPMVAFPYPSSANMNVSPGFLEAFNNITATPPSPPLNLGNGLSARFIVSSIHASVSFLTLRPVHPSG